MLILLPPSEGKASRGRGRPLDLARLSFPALTDARAQLLDALETTSAHPDAVTRLAAPAGAKDEVVRNTRIRELGTLPAERLYTGVLYDALGLDTLTGPARRRARQWIVVTSALFGATRLIDPLPPYRLAIGGRLDDVARLDSFWRQHLDPVLTEAAGTGVVLDCRSGGYLPMWRPSGALAARWVHVRVPGASHWAKHTRGLVARHLCRRGSSARTPATLAEEISEAFDVDLHEPTTSGQAWVLDVRAAGS